MAFVLRSGTVVAPGGLCDTDVWCDDGRVVALVAPGRRVPNADAIDVSGLLLFPGFIDPHVHSRDPGLTEKEDFEHSTQGAAAGGVTTILEMPNAVPPVTTEAGLLERAGYFASRAWVDFGLWGLAIGARNLAELEGLFRAGAVGVKLFWGYALDASTLQLIYAPTTNPVIPAPDAGAVLTVAREVHRVGGLLALHCEDRSILDAIQAESGSSPLTYPDLLAARPEVAEAAAVAVAAEIAADSGCHIHVVHLSSARATEVVRGARSSGIPLTGETCPHYLTLSTDERVVSEGRVKVYPPVRTADNQQALWAALADGVIESVGSDHAPHTVAEKQKPLGQQPAGMPGVETLSSLMVDGMCRGLVSPEQLAMLLSENPARIFGLYPRKGSLAPGSDADVTLVDPHGTTTISTASLHAKNPFCPWDSWQLKGRVVMSFLRGRQLLRDGAIAPEPTGHFLPAGHRTLPRRGPGAAASW